jgi:hypothetical protein
VDKAVGCLFRSNDFQHVGDNTHLSCLHHYCFPYLYALISAFDWIFVLFLLLRVYTSANNRQGLDIFMMPNFWFEL